MRRLRVREEVDGRTMADKTTDSVIPAEVSGLIDESQQIQGWIARLADFEKETSPAVYEKVLTDYQSRLTGVTGKLAAHRVDLVGSLERHRTDVESLRSERDEQAADLEEAKLRHAVGEIADSDWESRRSSIDGKLESLNDRISAHDATVAELESIISAIPAEGEEGEEGAAKVPTWMSGAGKEAVESEPAEEAEPSGEAEADDEPSAVEDEDEIAVAVAEEEPGDDEAGRPSEDRGGAGVAREAEEGEAPADEDEYLDELEFLESLSLEESDRFDAVSAMLEEDEGGKRASE